MAIAVRALVAVAALVGVGLSGPESRGADPLPRPALMESALAAFRRVQATRQVQVPLLTVIDYALSARERRFWVIDPADQRVLFYEFVAHGRGSATEDDPDDAIRFGNDAASQRSSLGTFLTGSTYVGKHGYSLELVGLDPGVNDNAMDRRIVVHGADYVSPAFRAANGGRVGRSWGCPALDPAVATTIIDRIKGGSVLYVGGTSAARS